MSKETKQESTAHRNARLTLHTDIAPVAVKEIAGALTALLAAVFALYIKRRTFTGI